MTAADRPFTDAVLAAPDDDLIRLQFADRLAETYYLGPGREERAEFIRVQCELEAQNWPCECGADHRRECRCFPTITLRRRERELWGANFSEWIDGDFGGTDFIGKLPGAVASFPLGVGAERVECEYRRGFAGVLQCSADFLTDPEGLCAVLAAAPIRRVWRQVHRRSPDWYGDGLVWLTTWPDVEWDQAVNKHTGQMEYRARLPGRQSAAFISRQQVTRAGDDRAVRELAHHAIQRLLRDEWPDVHFKLPSPAFDAIRRPPMPREGDDIRRVMRAMEGVAGREGE